MSAADSSRSFNASSPQRRLTVQSGQGLLTLTLSLIHADKASNELTLTNKNGREHDELGPSDETGIPHHCCHRRGSDQSEVRSQTEASHLLGARGWFLDAAY